MTNSLRVFAAALALTMLYESAFSAESAKTQVMLVGTYHFSNPGKDLNNVKAVDIFAAGRQQEIGKVLAGLGRFAPTQVAVEWPAAISRSRQSTPGRAGMAAVPRSTRCSPSAPERPNTSRRC